jgi:hypothetical protein
MSREARDRFTPGHDKILYQMKGLLFVIKDLFDLYGKPRNQLTCPRIVFSLCLTDGIKIVIVWRNAKPNPLPRSCCEIRSPICILVRQES